MPLTGLAGGGSVAPNAATWGPTVDQGVGLGIDDRCGLIGSARGGWRRDLEREGSL